MFSDHVGHRGAALAKPISPPWAPSGSDGALLLQRSHTRGQIFRHHWLHHALGTFWPSTITNAWELLGGERIRDEPPGSGASSAGIRITLNRRRIIAR